jgi:hypothetical protein
LHGRKRCPVKVRLSEEGLRGGGSGEMEREEREGTKKEEEIERLSTVTLQEE